MEIHRNGPSAGHDPLGKLDIPPELEPSLERHRQNLARLVMSLRSAGVDDTQIEESVTVAVASYRDELVHAMKRMARQS